MSNTKIIANRSDLVAVADAIRNRTGGTAGITLGDMPTAIGGITGGGIDTSDATATADKIFLNESAYVDNKKVIGTFTIDDELDAQDELLAELESALEGKASASEPILQSKTISPSTSSQSVTPDSGYDGLSDVTVEAILLQSKTISPSTSSQTVTPDSSYNGLSQVTVNSMPTTIQAAPSISVNSSGLITASATQTAGYVSAGTKSATKQLTTQAAKTWTPTTTNQTLSSGRYLTGAQTIKGDSNLVAGNIKSGVSIFGVAGSYEGSGGGSNGGNDLLKTVLEKTVTEVENDASFIDRYAFYLCSSLTTVSFPNCTSIGFDAFYFCSSLTTVSFPNCTSIGSSAFHGCDSLTTASFPNCTSIEGNAFRGCDSLTTVSFPNCTSIGSDAFYGCSSLTTASFPNCTSIGSSAFYNCDSLTTASFPNCTSIGSGAFYHCDSLTTASFPNCTSIGSSAFYNCDSLTTASFPNCTSIGSGAFYNCDSLTRLILTGSTIPTLGNREAFYATPLSSTGFFYVPTSLITSYQTATNWAYYSSRFSAVENYSEWDGIYGVGGSGKIITFTINGSEYQGEEGMTWGQWIVTDYNILGLNVDSNGIIIDGTITMMPPVLYNNDYDMVLVSDTLIVGEEYWLE